MRGCEELLWTVPVERLGPFVCRGLSPQMGGPSSRPVHGGVKPPHSKNERWLRDAALLENQVAFGRGELAPPSDAEFAAGNVVPDADTNESQGRMSNGSGHAANLAIFSLNEFEGKPGVWNVFPISNWWIARCDVRRGLQSADHAGQRADGPEVDAGNQPGKSIVVGNTFHLRPVFTPVTLPWIEQP